MNKDFILKVDKDRVQLILLDDYITGEKILWEENIKSLLEDIGEEV